MLSLVNLFDSHCFKSFIINEITSKFAARLYKNQALPVQPCFSELDSKGYAYDFFPMFYYHVRTDYLLIPWVLPVYYCVFCYFCYEFYGNKTFKRVERIGNLSPFIWGGNLCEKMYLLEVFSLLSLSLWYRRSPPLNGIRYKQN